MSNVAHRLRVFENATVKLSMLKTDEITGGWRKLHDEEIYEKFCWCMLTFSDEEGLNDSSCSMHMLNKNG
jgi:hypothetical protein